jgi:uncharacterized RmlC-like cupin family protein
VLLGSRPTTPDNLRAGAATPWVIRELALEIEVATMMRARAEAGACSDWHHHGARDVSDMWCAARLGSSSGQATESEDIETGGFFRVPAGLVHRDVNPVDQPQEIIMTVVGSGPLVVNVSAPAP